MHKDERDLKLTQAAWRGDWDAFCALGGDNALWESVAMLTMRERGAKSA